MNTVLGRWRGERPLVETVTDLVCYCCMLKSLYFVRVHILTHHLAGVEYMTPLDDQQRKPRLKVHTATGV